MLSKYILVAEHPHAFLLVPPLAICWSSVFSNGTRRNLLKSTQPSKSLHIFPLLTSILRLLSQQGEVTTDSSLLLCRLTSKSHIPAPGRPHTTLFSRSSLLSGLSILLSNESPVHIYIFSCLFLVWVLLCSHTHTTTLLSVFILYCRSSCPPFSQSSVCCLHSSLGKKTVHLHHVHAKSLIHSIGTTEQGKRHGNAGYKFITRVTVHSFTSHG